MKMELLITLCGATIFILAGLLPNTVYASPQVSGYDAIYIGSWYYAALYNITPQNETLDCSISIWNNETDPETLVYIQTQLEYELVETEKTCTLFADATRALCKVYIDPSYIVFYEPDPVDYSVLIQCENGISGKRHVLSENRKPMGDWLVRETLWIQENMDSLVIVGIIIVVIAGLVLLGKYTFF